MIKYTRLSEALEELEKRKDLRPKVEALLRERGVGLPWDPKLGNGKPLAVLFRQVATPNYETLRFLSIASGFGLQPLILEYTEDKLSMENVYKKSLLCTPIVEKISKKGHVHFRKRWICPPEMVRPQSKLSEIITSTGERLVDFHHKIFEKLAGEYKASLVDASRWFGAIGPASDYYSYFLSLFCSHALLFESFTYGNGEGVFTKNIVEPAFLGATQRIGEIPLIVPINPTEIEDSSLWVCYPKETT